MNDNTIIGLAFFAAGVTSLTSSVIRTVTARRKARMLDAQHAKFMAEMDKELDDLFEKVREDQKTARIKMDGSGLDDYVEHLKNKYNTDNPNPEN